MVGADYKWAYRGDQVEASDDDVVGGHERADELHGAGGAGLQGKEDEGGAEGWEEEEIDDGHDVEGAQRHVSGDRCARRETVRPCIIQASMRLSGRRPEN